MSFLPKIFNRDPMAALRRAVEQKRWADALGLAERAQDNLPPEQRAECEQLRALAGDSLAEINLAEGEAFLRAGETARGLEHLSLAAEQACTVELRERIVRLHASPPSAPQAKEPTEPEPAASSACVSGCVESGCGVSAPEPPPLPSEGEAEVDLLTRLEFILEAYPPSWRARYEALQGPFLDAFMRAHEGREKEALERLAEVPAAEHDDLFFFERGALRVRLGDLDEGRSDLEQALALNPPHDLALETLVQLDLGAGELEAAEARLADMMEQGLCVPFCHERLAELCVQKGDLATAITHCRQALELGAGATGALVVVAHALEKADRAEDAETLLQLLPVEGCGCGVSLPLAELWLRQGRELDLTLEAFKDALRREPGNPRWVLRIAQVYLGKGWQKEAFPMLEKLLATPELPRELQDQARELLQTAESW